MWTWAQNMDSTNRNFSQGSKLSGYVSSKIVAAHIQHLEKKSSHEQTEEDSIATMTCTKITFRPTKLRIYICVVTRSKHKLAIIFKTTQIAKIEKLIIRVSEKERECVCVCERERERERENVWERESEIEKIAGGVVLGVKMEQGVVATVCACKWWIYLPLLYLCLIAVEN